MKSSILLCMVCFTAGLVNAQTYHASRLYEIRSNIAATPCDVRGVKLYEGDIYRTPPYNSQIALVRRMPNDSCVVRFLTWTHNKPLNDEYNKPVSISSITNEKVYKGLSFALDGRAEIDSIDKYFLISREDLDSNCINYFTRGWRSTTFTVGLVTMPMKLRLGEFFDFQGNLSLGTTAGAKMRISKYNENYLNLLFGASISTVTLDSFSTKGIVSGQPFNNIAAFSPSLGLVFEFGKAQAGIFYGWDILNSQTQSKYGWVYNKKPWISVGFGFTIFNVNSESSGGEKKTQDTP